MFSSINLLVQHSIFVIALLIFSAFANFSLSVPHWNYTINKWINATVPYRLQSTFTTEEVWVILEVFQEISEKTCVKFVVASNETDFIEIRKDEEDCYSALGRIGGFQVIGLRGGSGPSDCINEANSCVKHGFVAYHVMHTLGFYPEHLRPDRDRYVKILWNNVKPGKKCMLKKHSLSLFDVSLLPYDYQSVMHGKLDLLQASNGILTIIPIKDGVSIGQKHGLSDGDIQKIRHVYCTANENLVNIMLLLANLTLSLLLLI